jgi:hypothetical protein
MVKGKWHLDLYCINDIINKYIDVNILTSHIYSKRLNKYIERGYSMNSEVYISGNIIKNLDIISGMDYIQINDVYIFEGKGSKGKYYKVMDMDGMEVDFKFIYSSCNEHCHIDRFFGNRYKHIHIIMANSILRGYDDKRKTHEISSYKNNEIEMNKLYEIFIKNGCIPLYSIVTLGMSQDIIIYDTYHK